jgi:hypothetical protein
MTRIVTCFDVSRLEASATFKYVSVYFLKIEPIWIRRVLNVVLQFMVLWSYETHQLKERAAKLLLEGKKQTY